MSDTEKDFNKVTITLEFAPDKWMGHDAWKQAVGLLVMVAKSLSGLESGRAQMDVKKEWQENW